MKRMHKSSNPCNNGKSTRRNNGYAKVRDISSKNVLENPVLCAQFLRDNVKVPLFKNVRPEDIEDVSERYRPYLGTEFESDTVKRIWLHAEKGKNDSLFFDITDRA